VGSYHLQGKSCGEPPGGRCNARQAVDPRNCEVFDVRANHAGRLHSSVQSKGGGHLSMDRWNTVPDTVRIDRLRALS
jgi:hypothetical protein